MHINPIAILKCNALGYGDAVHGVLAVYQTAASCSKQLLISLLLYRGYML